jgi:hypothetical protein
MGNCAGPPPEPEASLARGAMDFAWAAVRDIDNRICEEIA